MAVKRFLKRVGKVLLLVVVVVVVVVGLRSLFDPNKPGKVQDEAKIAGRTADSFPAADEDYFHDMDGGYKPGAQPLSENAIRGRNTWIVWTGGNDRFWDFMGNNTFGAFDLLKTVSSHPNIYANRDNRWSYLGLVNEPCFEKPSGPDPKRWGLWLDKRVESGACAPDPFANADKYKGVEIGARGKTVNPEGKNAYPKTLPVGSFYGEPSGIVGLRLFPNPDFDEEAAANWDADKYYTDPDYYQDKDLVRPYRVGMSCAFCHVGPSPTNPPADPENPAWANLNSNPGAQYFWVDRIFAWDTRPRGADGKPTENERSFIFQLFHTNAPGTLDTSLVSTDYINNPRTMNAVYAIAPRLGGIAGLPDVTRRWAKETLAGGELDNKQFQDYPQTANLSQYWDPSTRTTWTPRVLKDGADSAGALGALNRVYINIGLFSEEWLLHFNPIVGGQKITPIRIADAGKNSTYWNATISQTPDMAIFFVETAKPDKLEDAPYGRRYLTKDAALLKTGKVAFAENCAACHSSKIPEEPPEVLRGCEGGGNGPEYLDCWSRYREWTQTDDFKTKMTKLVLAPDFLDGNFLSTERRVPVTHLQTNACSPLATNAVAEDIWDNFASQSYKSLPSVGSVDVRHPLTGEQSDFPVLGGGRGFTRPASLISLWSTSPFLLANSVAPDYDEKDYYTAEIGGATATYDTGTTYESGYGSDTSSGGGYGGGAYDASLKYFDWRPSVDARVRSFDASIRKMLWPEKRKKDIDVVRSLGLPDERALSDAQGYLYRTTAASCFIVPQGYLPDFLDYRWTRGLTSFLTGVTFTEKGDLHAGPIPKGTPVNLVTNIQIRLDPDSEKGSIRHVLDLLGLGLTTRRVLRDVGSECTQAKLSDTEQLERVREAFVESGLVDKLVSISKCPDYVVNRGHYFGKDLRDDEKEALIAYLKTF
jgi:hypothetical protein